MKSSKEKAREIVHHYLLDKEPDKVPIYRIDGAEGLLRIAITKAFDEYEAKLKICREALEFYNKACTKAEYERPKDPLGFMMPVNDIAEEALEALKGDV